MAKEITVKIKLQIPAGAANPAPPVGPALGQHGVNIVEFCKAFNEKTQKEEGMIIPVVVTVYKDRSFSFITKTPPSTVLLKKAAGLAKASGTSGRETIGKVSLSQVREIAKIKIPDLNTPDLNKSIKIITGTAKSMGIEVVTEVIQESRKEEK